MASQQLAPILFSGCIHAASFFYILASMEDLEVYHCPYDVSERSKGTTLLAPR